MCGTVLTPINYHAHPAPHNTGIRHGELRFVFSSLETPLRPPLPAHLHRRDLHSHLTLSCRVPLTAPCDETTPTPRPPSGRTLGHIPGVRVSEAVSPITLSPVLADRHCGEGTKLILYMNPGELLSRTFTSKDTHSARGELLVVYADVSPAPLLFMCGSSADTRSLARERGNNTELEKVGSYVEANRQRTRNRNTNLIKSRARTGFCFRVHPANDAGG